MKGLIDIFKTAKNGETVNAIKEEYVFQEKDCESAEIYPSNNDGGKQKVVFHIKDKKDVTLDGNGARFVFDGKLTPFAIEDCENITLRNFTIDFLKPLCVQAKILDSNEQYIDLEIEKSRFPYRINGENVVWSLNGGENDCASIYIFDYDNDCRTGKKNYIMPNFVIGTHCENHGDSCLSKTTFDIEYPKYLLVKASEIKSGQLRLSYLQRSARLFYPKGERLILMLQQGDRSNDTIFVNNCKNVKFENVTISRGLAMGIIAQLCENIEINDCRVAPDTARGDLISTLADSMMFVDCLGKIEIKNSLISSSLDDGLNVHGTYSPIDKIVGNKIYMHNGHKQQRGYLPYRVGDFLQIIDKNTLKPLENGKVVFAEMDENKSDFIVELDKEIMLSDDVVCNAYNASAQPIVTVENCEYYRSTAILISSEKAVTFKNNKVHTLCGAMRIIDDSSLWYEAGKTNAVNIIGNEFNRCGEWSHDYLIQFLVRGGIGDVFSHRNAVIENNVFKGGNTQILKAQSVSGLTFKDNKVEIIDEISTDLPPVELEKCENMNIEEQNYERKI